MVEGAGASTACGLGGVDRPEMAPQALEKMESAPDKSALPHAFEAAPPAAEPARSVPADALEAGPPNDALPPAAESPLCDPAPTASVAGAQMAPQAVENMDSVPESDRIPAAAGPGGELSPHAGGFAPGVASPEEARPPADPVERPPMEWPESTAVVLAPDPAAPGGFRRMNIRLLRNGVAACADAA